MTAPAAPSHRNFILKLFILSVLTGNVSCLALRVDGSSSAHSKPTSPSPTTVLIHSVRQKGGITQRISWQEQDLNKPFLTSTQLKQPPLLSFRNKLLQIIQFRSLLSSLRSTFLPVSYPHQIPSGYLRYAIWSWTQDWSTQLRSVLATQRVLQGVGVGRSDATTLAALYNFMLRDGCGMLATLLFTAVASSNFGTNIKPWRLFADIMVDVGITLEVLASGAPTVWFLPMICVGNMCKAMCGVAAGACAGAINLHWATPPSSIVMAATPEALDGENGDAGDRPSLVVQAPPPNIADIQAKFNAQHTVTASLGLVMAAWFAKSVSALQHGWHLGILYTALTVLHLFANVQCLRCLALTSLNPTRFEMVTNHFMDWWYSQSQLSHNTTTSPLQDDTTDPVAGRKQVLQLPSLPTPTIIAKTEPLLFVQPRRVPSFLRQRFFGGSSDRPRIQMGVSFPDWWHVVSQQEMADGGQSPLMTTPSNNIAATEADSIAQDMLQRAKTQLAQQNYLLAVGQHAKHATTATTAIVVAFGQNITARQMAKAYLEALVLWSRRQHEQPSNQPSHPHELLSHEKILAWEQSDQWQHMWNAFQQSCARAGWNLDATQLPTCGFQIDWQ